MRRPRDLETGARWPRAVTCLVARPVLRPAWRVRLPGSVGVAVAALAIVAGCGPIEYLSQVSNRAASAVAAAKQAHADRYAPYEYTAAEEYLHKAREEAGYAQYQDAIAYGHKSEDLATRARAIAVARSSQAPGPAPAAAATPPAGSARERK